MTIVVNRIIFCKNCTKTNLAGVLYCLLLNFLNFQENMLLNNIFSQKLLQKLGHVVRSIHDILQSFITINQLQLTTFFILNKLNFTLNVSFQITLNHDFR